jgi:hypothetical protein
MGERLWDRNSQWICVEELFTSPLLAALIQLSLRTTLPSSGREYTVPVALKDCEVEFQQSKSVNGIMSKRACCRQTIKFPFLCVINLLRVDERILNAGKTNVIIVDHISA